MSFSHLGLSKDLLQAVTLAGFESPSPIQEQTIPVILKGQDLIAQAKTGSGKTAAFVLPLLQSFEDSRDVKRRILKCLILVPTRELTQQTADVIKIFARSMSRPVRTIVLAGGLNIDLQIRNLHHGADIAIATPGRLVDLIKRQAVSLVSLNLLIVDEADKMFSLGFAKELNEVLQALPAKRQNLLFSATMTSNVEALSAQFMNKPVRIAVEQEIPVTESIHQRAIEVNRNNRGPLLRHLIAQEAWDHVLVFVASIRDADMLAAKLRANGIIADALHGGMTQAQRTAVLSDFKKKKIKVLVATDLAARGLDIDQLPYVVNYDLPRSPNDYIHRIGRTARGGNSGMAVTFIGHEDQAHFVLIEKRMHKRLGRETIPGFALTGEALPAVKGTAPIKGHRMSKKDKARAQAAKSKTRG